MSHGRRMSTKMYLLAYDYCCLRDGEKCKRCGHASGDRTSRKEQRLGYPRIIGRLELDHVDGDPANNDPSNWRLLCRTCNLILERGGVAQMGVCGGEHGKEVVRLSRKERVAERVQQKERERLRERSEGNASTRIVREAVEFRSGEATMQANSFYEPLFRRYVLGEVRRLGQMKRKEARSAGSERVGCSPKTAERYLEKLASREGPLEVVIDEVGERWLKFRERLLEKSM